MFEPYIIKNYSDLSRNMRFPTMWYVRPAILGSDQTAHYAQSDQSLC